MKKRNEGIDLLRCISMLMVIVLHVLNHGGVLETATAGSAGYRTAWLLRSAAACAVNCYALISGYVGVKNRRGYWSILPLWLQVAFYSVLVAVLLPVVVPGVEQTPLVAMLFPVVHRQYWYFTAYFALFFLMPLLNKGIVALSRREAKSLVIALLAVFSVLSVLPSFNLFSAVKTADIFALSWGSSVMWLAVMYIVGGCIRQHGLGREERAWQLWAGYAVAVLAGWLFKLYVTEDMSQAQQKLLNSDVLLHSNAPTAVIEALCLLLLFVRREKLPRWCSKAVGVIAPSAFAVYLVHEHPMFRAGLIKGKFAALAADSPLQLTGKTLLATLAIFALGVAIDLVRRLLFRALRIRQATDWLASRFAGEEE